MVSLDSVWRESALFFVPQALVMFMNIAYYRNDKSIAIIKIMSAFISFFVGGIIYITFRSTSLRMFTWINEIGLTVPVTSLRMATQNYKVNDFILYCLPDGLWVTSYILVMDALWSNNRKQQMLWCCLLPIIGILSEILQLFNLVDGTFDYKDLLCYAFPYIIYLIFKKFSYEKI